MSTALASQRKRAGWEERVRACVRVCVRTCGRANVIAGECKGWFCFDEMVPA